MQELGQRAVPRATETSTAGVYPAVGRATRLDAAIRSARDYLLSIQASDGHWCGELEGDTILESEYILAMHFIGRGGEAKMRKAAEYLRRKQLPEGGWAIYPGGPAEVSASVKAYFVLKLLGDDSSAPHMVRARRVILQLGGIEACNSFTKIYLSIFGQYDWGKCPAVVPELILLPRWFYFNIYEMSSWSRAIVVPLSIIWAHKPCCPVPPEAAIDELHCQPVPSGNGHISLKLRFWKSFFGVVDRTLKGVEALPLKPLRPRALRQAEAWTLERLRDSDGVGAIFPPIVNTIIALRCLGYPMDHPTVQSQIRELEKLEIEDDATLHVQPCFSPVWDTALTLQALLAAGVGADDPDVVRAGCWLLDKEVRKAGDWTLKNPEGPVGGWFFEYANEFYPDCDDTAEVLTVLAQLRPSDEAVDERRRQAMERGLQWLLSMQNRDGGWAAFDKGCDKEILTYIPFADHNAMIDPSCEDVTGRSLETLAHMGFARRHPAVRRAVEFLRRTQEPDGTWYGRWGANYIYGTWLALTGLRAVGEEMSLPAYRRSGDWLRSCQNPDGGWGESLRSYDEPDLKGRGESTAAQTAWALLGLFALDDCDSPAVQAGIDYLLRTQRPDGSWCDEPWTATGFPRVFYLRYHLYATYFPLSALAAYERCKSEDYPELRQVAANPPMEWEARPR